jgi:hypothetical protein
VSFVNVNPDKTCKILGHKSELCPVFAAVIVALVGRRTSEAQRQTDDETKNGKQELVDANWRWLIHVVG